MEHEIDNSVTKVSHHDSMGLPNALNYEDNLFAEAEKHLRSLDSVVQKGIVIAITNGDRVGLRLCKVSKKGCGNPIPLKDGHYGKFYTSSVTPVYIDEWDLYGQRKTQIPVVYIRDKDKKVWLQADKDISKTHPSGDEVTEFYRVTEK